jgi:hypothetical protein
VRFILGMIAMIGALVFLGCPWRAMLRLAGGDGNAIFGVLGLAFALAGGCPGRQLFMAGEGDGDAAVFALGMVGGAAVSHNFGLASTPKGVGPHGIIAVIICLIVLLFIGFTMRQKA